MNLQIITYAAPRDMELASLKLFLERAAQLLRSSTVGRPEPGGGARGRRPAGRPPPPR